MLDKTYSMREENEFAIIFNNNFEDTLNYFRRIPLTHYGILRLFDGRFTQNDIVDLYQKTLNCNTEYAEKEISYILTCYDKYLRFNRKQERRTGMIKEHLCCENKNKYYSEHRLNFPLVISLVLTYKCDCFCKYCFVDANKKNISEKNISLKKINEIIDEAALYGTYALNITGGDPFTRPDIFSIIEKSIKKDMCINISTKVILNTSDIERLAATGLRVIQISLDSIVDDEEKILIGRDKFPSRMLECIVLLIRSGIDVNVNTVVTHVNIKSIPALIERLEELGVKKHYITPYLRTLGRHDELLFPTEEEYNELSKYIKGYAGKMIVNYKEPNSSGEINGMSYRCTGGRMGLVIRPDGKVSICERLIDTEECIVGDINEESICDIWNGERLLRLLHPHKNQFAGMQCYSCNEFKECIWDRGLCLARCKISHGNIYTQDPLCYLKKEKVRFV